MAILKEELQIKSVKDIFAIKNLEIPDYQRPYRWNHKSANILLNDIIEAKNNNIPKYRLGTVILHQSEEKGKNVNNIVDGQQRLTTLTILLYCIDNELNEKNKDKEITKDENAKAKETEKYLLGQKYSDLSYKAININYNLYKKRLQEFDIDELKKIKEYILEKCEIVKIVTAKEQEAFQFFDSQNNRGKSLNPHDLLKSYHLREMNNMKTREKTDLINNWEDIDQKTLADLFKTYLYPVIRWYKKKDGLGFSEKEIDIFKGIKQDNIFNYAQYHKASNIFTEQFNKSGNNELLGIEELNQFQLTQPIISGKRFFYYVLHYENLLQQIRKKMLIFEENVKAKENNQEKNKEDFTMFPDDRYGDRYIKELYECILLFFADKFSLDSLNDNVMKRIYVYCYSLRLSMEIIQQKTVNNYASGEISPQSIFEDKDAGIAVFEAISEMNHPNEMELLLFPRFNIQKGDKYDKKYNKGYYKNILNFVRKWNGMEYCSDNNQQDKKNGK